MTAIKDGLFLLDRKLHRCNRFFYYEKGLSNDLKFPSGKGFYPDEKDGIAGYNTDPARGADTFTLLMEIGIKSLR